MNFRVWIATIATIASFAGTGCRVSANFHEVDPGRFYRSAQLTGSEFELAINQLGIRTIISLRGGKPGEEWFDEEAAAASKHGVHLITIGMSAKRLPHRADLIKLLDTYRDAPRPILVHCLAGADRTGEATAIYMLEYMGKTKKEALGALTPATHHWPIFTPAKRYFIREYKGRDWAYNTYDPCVQQYKYYDQSKLCAHASDEAESEADEMAALTANAAYAQ